ncbi:hypothetical protein [Spirosoma sp. KUDC1026]|uniref:hypothetical protein n=1 Tax=Spirosoma sp. KUDC1026 TaxID=2745947 RepID=UPI00159BAF3E|nr:hypothetical protein [Spirosoma sp. KUDC1026]QKZ11915.1 hypothetical protein HU175_04420 [Spirosoma sp. KUDC1026]
MQYDFKKYHYRSMNAVDNAERAAINQELKDLYDSLPGEEQADFNRQLQAFLAKEMGRIKSSYESIQGNIDPEQ